MAKYLPKFPVKKEEVEKLSRSPIGYWNKKLAGYGGVYNSLNNNLYNYTHQNPIKLVDPNGKEIAWFGVGWDTGVGVGTSGLYGAYAKITSEDGVIKIQAGHFIRTGGGVHIGISASVQVEGGVLFSDNLDDFSGWSFTADVKVSVQSIGGTLGGGISYPRGKKSVAVSYSPGLGARLAFQGSFTKTFKGNIELIVDSDKYDFYLFSYVKNKDKKERTFKMKYRITSKNGKVTSVKPLWKKPKEVK